MFINETWRMKKDFPRERLGRRRVKWKDAFCPSPSFIAQN